MSEEKKIENLFGDALKKFGATPPVDLKNQIAGELTKKGFIKKGEPRKNYLRWFGVIALLVATVATVYFWNERNSENNFVAEQNPKATIATNETTHNKTATSIEKNTEANHLGGDKEKTDSENPSSSSIQNVQQKNDDAKIKSTETSNSTNNKVANTNKKISESIDISKKTNSAKQKNGKTFSGKMISENENKSAAIVLQNKKSSTKNGTQKKSDQSKQNSITKTNNNGASQNANATSPGQNNVNGNLVSGNQNDSTHAKTTPSEIDSTSNAQSQTLAALEKETIRKNDSIAKTLEEQKQKAMQDSLAKNPNKKSKFLTGISVDVFGGPQWSTSKFSSSESKYDSLASELKNSETEKTSYSFGASVNLAHNNILLQPCINYSMLKSAFDYVHTQTALDSSNSYYNYLDSMIVVYDSVHQIYDTIIWHYDSTYVLVLDTFNTTINSTTSNTVSIFEIPLLLGYKFSTGKFDFEIHAGVSIGFVTGASGATHSPSGELIFYNNVGDSPYRKNYWNFIGNLSAVYNINKRFAFFVQPAAKIGLSSVYKSGYAVSKNMKQYSVGVGLRIKF